MNVYTPDLNKPLHVTSVDFESRNMLSDPVHLVQGDDTLPTLEVKLYKNGNIYAIPNSFNANIRVGKRDNTFVLVPAIGKNSAGTSLYFTIDKQMCAVYGQTPVIIELVDGSKIAGSSTFYFEIDKNPIQPGFVESTSEWATGWEIVEEAKRLRNETSDFKNQTAQLKSDTLQLYNNTNTLATEVRGIRDDVATDKTQVQTLHDEVMEALDDAQDLAEAVTQAANTAVQQVNTAKNTALTEINHLRTDIESLGEQTVSDVEAIRNQAVTTIETTAQTAVSSMTGYVEQVENFKIQASQARDQAESFAGQANASAQNSNVSKNQAKQFRDEAEGFRNEAANSATEANQARDEINQKALEGIPTVQINTMLFSMGVEEDGYLYVYADTDLSDNFDYVESTGMLYFLQELVS